MSYSKFLGGIFLVSGTTIGAGMLALPVITGLAGFYPSVIILVCYWIYMTYTAYLVLEVTLWSSEKTNLITMAKRTLGPWGEFVSWLTYLFLLYTLTTAYIAGSGPIFIDFIYSLSGLVLPTWLSSLPLFLIFCFFVYKGTESVDYINRFLMFALALSYSLMMAFLMPHVQTSLLNHIHWNYLLLSVSVVATSFGFHIIIPTLTTYLDYNVSQLKKVIFIGSLIPLIIYISWEYLTLGIVPLKGSHGIIQGYLTGSNGVYLLTELLGHTNLALTARFFSFFAIITSFLGVSLSLSDFLSDGLNISKKGRGAVLIYALTFFPPLVFSMIDPRAFINALEYAGAFGVMILLGLIPALMVWKGRYEKQFTSTFKTVGGKMALIMVIFIAIIVIGIEIFNKLGLLPEVAVS